MLAFLILCVFLIESTRAQTTSQWYTTSNPLPYECTDSQSVQFINVLNGRISSPYHPGNYPPNMICSWNISMDINTSVRVDFDDLDTEACCDVVRIFDGPDYLADLIRQISGNISHSPVSSTFTTGSQGFIQFISDGSIESRGFVAKFNTDPGCRIGSSNLTDPDGYITSPYYPYTYSYGETCLWRIKAPPGTRIVVKFLDFVLEGTPSNCLYDYLQLFDGSSFVGQYCGTMNISDYLSVNNEVTITFFTDNSVQYRGFHIYYHYQFHTTTTPNSSPTTSTAFWEGVIWDLSLIIPVNGTLVTADGSMINSTCGNKFKDEIRQSAIITFDNINKFAIGKNICLYARDLIIYSVDVNFIYVGKDAACRVDFHLPYRITRTLGEMHDCANEISLYVQNHTNWVQPIIPTPNGCPALVFQPIYFDPQEIFWKCFSLE